MMLASCGGHEHDISTEWSKNESGHWHECSGCDEHFDEAAHTFGEWQSNSVDHWAKCTECDYLSKTAHVFDQQVEDEKYIAVAGDCKTPATYYNHVFVALKALKHLFPLTMANTSLRKNGNTMQQITGTNVNTATNFSVKQHTFMTKKLLMIQH